MNKTKGWKNGTTGFYGGGLVGSSANNEGVKELVNDLATSAT